VLAGCTVIGAANALALRQYPALSLRYEAPISGDIAYEARLYAIEQGGEDSFWPTFWHERQAQFSAEYSGTAAGCILYSGEASLVWQAAYLSGYAPGVTDSAGCAVSSGLAWVLWGSADVLGKTVEVDGEARIIRGVFEGENPLALLAYADEDKTQSYSAVELSGGPSSPARDDVESFAVSSGLGQPDYILMGTPSFLASVIAVLPVLVLAFYGAALLTGRIKKRSRTLWRIGMLCLLLCIAISLSAFLDALPDWLIPTRWSDFSFWSALMEQIGNDLREYLAIAPCLRDVTYSMLLWKQAGITFLTAALALLICFLSRGRLRREASLSHSTPILNPVSDWHAMLKKGGG
jgi:hypothetical protein